MNTEHSRPDNPENPEQKPEHCTAEINHAINPNYVIIKTAGSAIFFEWCKVALFIGAAIYCANDKTQTYEYFSVVMVVFAVMASINILRAIKRNALEFDGEKITLTIGRIFVVDDEMLPLSSVSSILLDKSLVGRILGYCTIRIITRASNAIVMHNASEKQATAFRDKVMSEMAKK